MEAISGLAKAPVLLSSPGAEELGGGDWKKRKTAKSFPVFSTTVALLYGITPKICLSMLRQGRAGQGLLYFTVKC